MSEPLEKEVQLHERNAQGQDVLIYPLPPGGYPLAVSKGGTGAENAADARSHLGITPGNIGAAASDHTHNLPDLEGTLPVTKGGTGATDAAAARTNLGAAASVHTHALTGSDITGTLPLSKGGTGQTSAAAVRSALGLGNTTGALPVVNGGTGAAAASDACDNLGAVKKSGDTMTGNLSVQGYLYPSVYLLPTYNNTTNRTVFEGSYVGASSFSAWEDSTGGNRRMLEVRTAAYEPSLDNAVVLRAVINSSYYTYRVFHAGMATPVPVGNGGTGASSAKAALQNLGVFYADTLPSGGTDGQICLVPVG